jgi:ribosomal protein S18 acetylase RimI-like enzyme
VGPIRKAESGDYDGVIALLREADELHARILPSFFRTAPGRRPARTREELARLCAARDEDVRVFLLDGAPVGLVHTQIYDTPAVASMVPKRRAHIDTLIVTATQRRRGIGRAMLAAAQEWARGQGAREILLTVWAGNEEAERFYEALGFMRVSSVLGRDL